MNYNTYYIIIGLIFFLCGSCKFNVPVQKEKVSNFKLPVIIDTLPQTSELKKCGSLTISDPVIIGIRPFGDICLITDRPYLAWDTAMPNTIDKRADGIQFIVDTAQCVTMRYNKDKDYYHLSDTTQSYYKGLPCYIYNETAAPKWLYTQDARIIVIQEARDSNYEWRPIEVWNWSWCGNSYDRTPIKPGHYLLFETPLYFGKFYTDLRLKLYSKDAIYYSNEYKGKINYGQFTVPKQLKNDKGELAFNLSFLTN